MSVGIEASHGAPANSGLGVTSRLSCQNQHRDSWADFLPQTEASNLRARKGGDEFYVAIVIDISVFLRSLDRAHHIHN